MAENLPREAGTVVVGGGTSGNVIAARLALAGVDTLVLEAGPDFGPFGSAAWPADLLDATRLGRSHDWGYDSGDTLPTRVAFERARAIGGCSDLNGTTQTWGHRRDYDAWAAAGNPGWSADELRPLFAEATRIMRVKRYRAEELTPWQRAWYDAGSAIGLPRLETLNDLDQTTGFAPEDNNIVDGVRWNTAFAYLDPVRHLEHLRIAGRAHVDRVLVRNGRATGVVVLRHGQSHVVRAGRVVVCGGAYNSPQVLQRSGIGEPTLLKELGIEVVADLPGVGENLHDQPFLLMSWAGSEAMSAAMSRLRAGGWAPDEQAMAKAASSFDPDVFDMHFLPYSPTHRGKEKRWSCGVGALLPRSRGHVRIRSLDPEEKPLIDHRFLGDPEGHDAQVLAEGIEQLRAIAASPGMRDVVGSELRPGPDVADRAALLRHIRANPDNYWHPVGTCKMGPAADPDAVVGHDGRVHGVADLFVADCSIMPTVPRATTAMPAVVIGERVARFLIATR
ncbi:FAD-dependent oxidoreductase [Phytohabitans sp. ZYX-F-186]|uniref:FAD-dependent oxidoreductase n=1 Tax=Phytohabitans maris TaxID=3071409 RepID=A0ABU0Z9C6_9ACTN|nr:FAD-dependent oxidoreductase [Phytohabitans sp. ZYX-F-186]MDQ7903648.1 FAD-dependent oxidoreductase [Phytohabitans sp. ZYX-F-186]